MNAGQLYVGEYYAYYEMRPRGIRTPIGAKKVRVTNIETRKDRFATNAKTFVHVVDIDSGREKVVRARDIIDFWDSYEAEASLVLQEREERQRSETLRQLKKAITESAISFRANERGLLVAGNTNVDIVYGSVSFPLDAVLSWLEISEDEITTAVNRNLASDPTHPSDASDSGFHSHTGV